MAGGPSRLPVGAPLQVSWPESPKRCHDTCRSEAQVTYV